MKVLVTGHRGYIGTILTPMLEAAGHEVHGLDSDLYRRCTFSPGGTVPEVPSHLKDIRDVVIDDLIGFDAVLHLAALSNDPLGDFRPETTYAINLEGTKRLAEAAKDAGVRRFIFSSSCSNYGAGGSNFIDERGAFNPVTPYGRSKVEAEQSLSALAEPGFSPTALRSATAYGVSPRIRFDLVLNNLVAWALTTGKIHLKSDGSAWRPIVHIEDIARAFLAVLEAPLERVHNQAFNVGITAHNYRVRDIADIVAQAVPGCDLSFAKDAGPDKRSYRVNCDRIQEYLPEFAPQWTPERGVETLIEAIRAENLTLEAFEGPRYQRIGHIKKLIADGIIDETLRHCDRLMACSLNISGGMARQFSQDAAATQCVSCREHGLLPILDLGRMPRSDGLLEATCPDKRGTLVPLRLGYCPSCSLVQLLETRPPQEMFGDDYYYFSSFSEDLLEHSRNNALELVETRKLDGSSLVVEVASNDGYMLKNFLDLGVRVLGIDPATHPVQEARASGVNTICDFFGQKLAVRLASQGVRADLIIANNVVAHVEEQNDFVAGLSHLLAEDGLVVIEFPYIRDLVDNLEFDTIYHEHRCYFSLRSAKMLFARHGLFVNDVRRLVIHGGSLRLYLSKQDRPSLRVKQLLDEEQRLGLSDYRYYADFGQRVQDFRTRAQHLVRGWKDQGKRIAAYGAAAKGTIMLNFLNLNSETIDYVVDRNIHKQGKYMPGVGVRIDDPGKLDHDRPDYVMILPWNFRDEIIRQQRHYLKTGGRFLVPIPQLEIVEA